MSVDALAGISPGFRVHPYNSSACRFVSMGAIVESDVSMGIKRDESRSEWLFKWSALVAPSFEEPSDGICMDRSTDAQTRGSHVGSQ